MLLKVKITYVSGDKRTVFMGPENAKQFIEELAVDDAATDIKSIKVSRNEKFPYIQGNITVKMMK